MYALIVCFVSITVGAIGLGTGIYGLVGMYYPHITIRQIELENVINNLDPFSADGEDGKVEYSKLSEEAKQHIIDTRRTIALNMEKRKSLQGLIGSTVIVFVALLVFVPHWLIARRERKH